MENDKLVNIFSEFNSDLSRTVNYGSIMNIPLQKFNSKQVYEKSSNKINEKCNVKSLSSHIEKIISKNY